MENLGILLKALLDPKSTQDITKQIQNLQNIFNKSPIKLKIDVDNAELKKLSEQISNISSKATKNIKTSSDSEAQIKLYNSLQKVYKEEEKQRLSQEKYSDKALADKEKILQYEQKVRQAIEGSTQKEELKTKELQQQISLYQKRMQLESQRITGKYGSLVDNNSINSVLSQANGLTTDTKDVQNKMKQTALSMKEVELQAKNNSKAFKAAQQDSIAWGAELVRSASKFTEWYLLAGIVTGVIGLLKQIPEVVTQINTSLTEINKVLNLTSNQMKNLSKEATELGIQYGRTTVEVLDSIGAFAKAGLDENTSKSFAQLAMLLSNVGDMSAESAQKTLIMANAGYQLGNDYKTLNTLISQFNILANNNAVEVDTLSEAWQNSASMAKQAKLSITDYNAILTVAGSSSQKSGAEIGNAIKTILMRLQGVTDGADTLEEDVSKVDKVLSDLGIQIKKSPTEFKPAMDSLTQIAKKYRELGESGQTVKQSEMLETLAGKYRANILASLLNNFDQIDGALQDQSNSFQSAEKENARYMDSIQAKTKALQAQWELMASNTLDSDIIKGFVDGARSLISLLDSDFVRIVGTIALFSAGIYGLGIGFNALTKSTLGTTIGVIALDVAEKGLIVTSKAIWATMVASPLFWVIAATTAVYALAKGFDAINISVAEQKEKVEEAKKSYEETTNEVKTLNEELEATNKRIDELNSKSKLEITKKDELSKLQLTNKELQLRIALLEKEEEIKSKHLGEEQQTLYKKQFSSYNFSDAQVEENLNTAKTSGYYDMLRSDKNDLASMSAAYKLFSETKKEALESGNLTEVNRLGSILTDIQESLIASSKELQTTKDNLSALKEPSEEQKKILVDVEQGLKLINNIVIPDKLGSITDGFKESILPIEKEIKSFEDLTKEVKSAVSSVKDLNDIQADLSKGNKLTADSVLDIVTKYPELLEYIHQTADGYIIEAKGMDIVRKALIDKQMVALESESGITAIMKTELQNRLNVYGIELESIKTLNDARNAFNKLNQNTPRTVERMAGLYADQAALDSIAKLNALKGLLTSGIKTGVKEPKTSKADPSPIAREDMSDAYIRAYNAEVEKDKILNKNLETQLKTAESAKDYAKQIEITNKLLKNEQKTITDLGIANSKISNKADSLRKANPKYRTDTWFDVNNEATTTYANLINSFEGKTDNASKREQAKIKDLFNSLYDLKNAYKENKVEVDSYKESLNQLGLNKISLLFQNFEDSLKPVNKELSELEHQYNMLGDNELAAKEQNLNAQLVEKANLINKINTKILEYKKLLASTKDKTVKDMYQDEIDKLDSQANELEESLIQHVKKANDEKLDLYGDVVDKIKDLLKKQYDLEEKALDSSLDKYKEYVNGIIQERDRLADSEDYNESINESNTKIAEIQSEIDKRSMAASQGDMVAANEIAEYQKQKTEEEKNLKDKQKDWERKKTKENLEDQIDYYEDYTNDQKKLLAEKTTDTALQLQAESILAKNNITEVQNFINNLFTITGENASKVGQLIQSELISKLQQAMDIQNNLSSITSGSSNGSNSNIGNNSNLGKTQSYRETTMAQMRINSNAYGTASDEEKKRLSDESLKLGTSIGWTRNNVGVWYDENGKLAQYANGTINAIGGLSQVNEGTKGLNGTELRVLGKGDGIITADLTKNLNMLAMNVPNILQNFMPKFNIPNLTPIASGAGSITIGDININGVTSVDKSTLPTLQSGILNQIKIQFNKGGTFG